MTAKRRYARAAIFLNGFYDKRYPEFYAAACRCEEPFVVCADGALLAFNWLNEVVGAGLVPHLVVGDFDSLDPTVRCEWEERGVRFSSVVSERSAKEDYTDGQLALYAALDAGSVHLDFYGALPRPDAYDHDHFLGNLFLLSEAHGLAGDRPGFSARVSDPLQAIYLCADRLTLPRQGPGLNRVSLVPFGGEGRVRSTVGLRWELRDFVLTTTRANALRNEFLPDEDEVTIVVEGRSAPIVVAHTWL